MNQVDGGYTLPASGTGSQLGIRMDGGTDGWMDGWMGGWAGGFHKNKEVILSVGEDL